MGEMIRLLNLCKEGTPTDIDCLKEYFTYSTGQLVEELKIFKEEGLIVCEDNTLEVIGLSKKGERVIETVREVGEQ